MTCRPGLRCTNKATAGSRLGCLKPWCMLCAYFRRLARDDKRVAETLVGLHFVAFAILMRTRCMALLLQNAQHALGHLPANSAAMVSSFGGMATPTSVMMPRM